MKEFEMETITSRQNQKVLDAVRLKDRKYREEQGLFAFEGRKLFIEALEKKVPLVTVFCTDERLAETAGALKNAGSDAALIHVSDSVYEKLSEEKSPEGIFCIAKALDKIHKIATIYKADKMTGSRMLLERMQDPGNLGTVIRTARAFGLPELILSDDCADLYSKKTVRASMGTLFAQPITRVKDPVGSVKALQNAGYKVYAAALREDAIALPRLSGEDLQRVCIVIGNEGNGISEELLAVCDGSVIIPMAPGTESLNAAAASTVFLWELYRNQ